MTSTVFLDLILMASITTNRLIRMLRLNPSHEKQRLHEYEHEKESKES